MRELPTSDERLRKLRMRRDGWEAEQRWVRFLIDAYFGTGGFLGETGTPPSSFWGPAAEMYDGQSLTLRRDTETYLDRFPREDSERFARRVAVSHYPNYIEPVISTKLSFLNRQAFGYDASPAVDEWLNDPTGRGISWHRFMTSAVRPRAAVCGWCPVVLEAPAVDDGQSRAQAAEAGGLRARPLFPGNVLAWHASPDGRVQWVKVQEIQADSSDPFNPPQYSETITIYTAEWYYRWQIGESSNAAVILDETRGLHDFGVVPVFFFRPRASFDDEVQGTPLAWSESKQAKRLFNLLSEIDEHVRSSVFAILTIPTDRPDSIGELQVGSSNALAVPTDSKNVPAYIAPPATVAATLETRIVNTIDEIYRMARLEFTRGTKKSAQAQSGESQAFSFEDTNRAISDLANEFAATEESVLKAVDTFFGGGGEVKVTSPDKFNVEELLTRLKEAFQATTLKLGPTFNAALKKRLVGRMLPNLDDATVSQIEGEIDEGEVAAAEQEAHAAQEQAAYTEALRAATDGEE